ncbi:DUF3775 domain-containing protein [Janibacter terrae]|uniref:DUF3775 domain-containing protein n=1 Tax=Janibacter terrae TaxID=103817 RepID=UPI0008372F7A|nr:DUF3775 domain-containing protein [Janibacter terrae]
MTQHSAEEMDAAREAAQKAVDTATSWDYSAGEAKIADKLREGLDAAGVTVDDEEFARLVTEIDAVAADESVGTPTVRAASPR